jgi:hypothetical protein
MIWKFTTLAMFVVAVTAFVTSQAVSQEQPSDEAMQEAMKKWMEVSTPGEQHEFLMERVGKWNTKMKFWMGGPGSPSEESTGTSEMSSVLGGRWLMEKSSGTIMGMPHEGYGLTGYDKFRKQFRSVWLDNMSTTMYLFSGYLDRTGKILTTYGEMDEPGTGEIAKMSRFVTTIVSDDEFILTGFDLGLGDDARVMEITYQRVK